MSRVFLADDIALDRAVVIKVLHPELAAGVNAERFKREVFLSARLQHPHIVPVLTAGDVDGLPYYVMPFVKGESLRARIAQGPLPIGDTIGIIGDVAKALGYAHSEDVVHRDIKPDNILLSGGAATVADFGIAKALSSARRTSVDGALTSLGTSLGTPAYMAPEQVAGDPDTDHRADIYSLGCVAYEMLTGRSPFAGKSPQQMLAAQVMEQPAPMETLRPGIPRSLAALVMRCLEKEPAKRPQTAAEITAPLEAGPIADAAPPSRRWRAPLVAAAVATALIALAIPFYRRAKSAPAPDGSMNLAVAPFEVLDPQLGLWREGIVDVLSRNLDGAGPIKSMSPGVTIKGWTGHADRASAVAFGRKVGAQLVVYGQLQAAGAGLVSAKLWVVDTDRDVAPVEVEVRDSVARMDRVTDSLSVRSLAAISRLRTIGAAQLASLGSSSLPAIRAFLQGAQYYRRTQWDSATVLLRQAVAIDSSFGIAYAMLGAAHGWISEGGNNELQWKAYERAGELIRPGLSPHDSLMLAAVMHYARANRRGTDRGEQLRLAYAATGAVTERYPDDAYALFLLADMRFHNDRQFTEREALAGFDRAIRADSDFAPAYIHAIDLAYRNGAKAGSRYAEAFLRRRQSAVQRDAMLFASAMATGELAGARLRAVLDTISPEVARNSLGFLRRMADTGEVVIDVLRAAAKRMPPPALTNIRRQLSDALAMRGHIAESFKLSIDEPGYTAAEIVALGLVPADSAAKLMMPWLNRRDDASIATIAVLGAARDTATLKRLVAGSEKNAKADTSAFRKIVMTYVARSAHAYQVLSTGDSATATQLFDALSDSVISLPVDQYVRARLVARKDPRRAVALLDRMSSTTDLIYVARQLEIARLSEKLGDKERAVDAYAYVADAWRRTDSPVLRSAVTEASAALQRLDADGRLRTARLSP